jgi:hypothetical protein
MRSAVDFTLYLVGAIAFGIVIGYAQLALFVLSLFKKEVAAHRVTDNNDDDIYFAGCGGFLP